LGDFLSGIIVGLDVGTSLIKTVIGELDADNTIKIIGFAKRPSPEGMLRNGVVVNIDAAVTAITDCIEAAEQMAGHEVTEVYTAIGGSLVEGQNSEGEVVVDESRQKRPLEIREDTVNRAREAAEAIMIPLDREILHSAPQTYIVDNIPTKQPVGVMGMRLKVKIHIITASKTICRNMEECIGRAHYVCGAIWAKTMALALATIHEDEMSLGSILIDLGAGTTDVMVVNNGAPVYMTSIEAGGNAVTNDIAQVYGIPFAEAEKVKLDKGSCLMQPDDPDEEVLLPPIGGLPPVQSTQSELCAIIQPRMIEIFRLAKRAVAQHSGLKKLNGSIVLTGGGALLPGVVPLAQQLWGTASVRIGEVSDFGGIDKSYRDSVYSTAVGLLLARRSDEIVAQRFSRKKVSVHDDSPNKLFEAVGNVFKKFF
jgi:cell division protein FtsA